MSDHELYDIVERRIDQRNRRRIFWAFDLAGLVAALALMVAVEDSGYAQLGVAIFLAWGGLFTLHSILMWVWETRQADIENEVAKLRQATYEKPKRLELSDEGELVDPIETGYEDERRSRNLQVE